MKKILSAAWLVVLITSFPAFADSIVRVRCDDEDTGAEIFFNGKYVGSCPQVDAPAKDGVLNVHVRKALEGDREQIFDRQLRVVDGVVQKLEVTLSQPQLTAKGKAKKEEGDASALLRSAEAGNVEAMKKIADFYDSGTGVEKSPAKARAWREKAETATAQAVLRSANAGNISAMENIASRYESGRGVNKDVNQAQAWRQRAVAAKQQKAAVERESAKQAKLNSVSYFEKTGELFNNGGKRPSFTEFYIIVTSSPIGLASDLLLAPSKTTERNRIESEAALRPSTWGKPDSMMARASRMIESARLEADIE